MKQLLFYLLIIANLVAASDFRMPGRKKRYFLKIEHSNSSGTAISPSEYLESDELIFSLQLLKGKKLKSKDLRKRMPKIKCLNGENILSGVQFDAFPNRDDFQKILMRIGKWQIDETLPIRILNDMDDNFSFSLPEEYWECHPAAIKALENSKAAAEAGDYFSSISNLNYFSEGGESIQKLSFLQEVKGNLAEYLLQFEKNWFENISTFCTKSDIHSSELSSINLAIERYGSEYSDVIDIAEYLGEAKVTEIQAIHLENLNVLNDEFQRAIAGFIDLKMKLFQNANYHSFKFAYYVDLLARILIRNPQIQKVEQFSECTVDLQVEYPEEYAFMESLNWADDFSETLVALNLNLQKGYLFPETVMVNLDSIKDSEYQPYFRIFTAFNWLAANDIDAYADEIENSFMKCTDKDMLYQLETCFISYLATINNVDEKILSAINKGIQSDLAGDLESAESSFKRAQMLSGNMATPFYYLGKINFQIGNAISAERYFSKALEVYPQFMAPAIFTLKYYFDSNEYEKALSEVEKILTVSPNWFFYYWKARALFNLERYQDAVNVVLEQCITINGFNFEQYIFLGKIFILMNDFDSAEKYFLIAGDIQPENQEFIESIENLNMLREAALLEDIQPPQEEKTPDNTQEANPSPEKEKIEESIPTEIDSISTPTEQDSTKQN